MDALEKERVASLRKEGHSYTRIAQILGVPLGSVKSFCSRNEVKRETAVAPKPNKKPGVCRQCGALVTQLPHRKEKRFCSDACRTKWWNGQRSKKKNRKYRRISHDDRAV